MIKVNQIAFIEDLLTRFNMTNCNPASTPMIANLQFEASEETVCPPDVPYQSLIGSLMYLAVNSRPDIAYATAYLSQFNTKFTTEHWQAAKRVLRYLKGTKNFSLCYEKDDRDLIGFADADWAQNKIDRKSYSGYVFCLSSGPISWMSKKQSCVAQSSTESEYIALSEASKEAVFLRGLLNEILNVDRPTTLLFSDSQGADNLSKNPVLHNRSKHIDVRFHYIRECVEKGTIVVKYLSTDKMPADALTKPLPGEKLRFCRNAINLI